MLKLERRRSSIEVIGDILRLGEAGKTEIMYTVNMSHSQLQKYLNLLLWLKLVNKTIGANQLVTYRVTPKGFTLLRKIDNMLEILKRKSRLTFGISTIIRTFPGKTSPPCNPHMLRRMFASILAKYGVDSLHIRRLGRWESMIMLERYTSSVRFQDSLRLYAPIIC